MHGERASAGLVMHIAESPIQRYCDIIIIIVGDSAVAPLSLVSLSLSIHPSRRASQAVTHLQGKLHRITMVVWCIGGKVRAAAL